MKKSMKLLNLALNNFKGVQKFELKSNGESIKVAGDNATGKTTLFDAFIWLLFDKDSTNKKDFQIKTTDELGNELHGLDHEVEAEFSINGEILTFKKSYKEKWTKKRGSATKDFTGHTTDYFIDTVPAKKKEFTDKVSSIVDEDAFKLLTSPSYFNEQLKWQKRREILLEICGDISDEDVIASNDKLSELPQILGDRSIEDQRKIIASKRIEINRELEKIPVRINEVERNIPDLSDLNEQNLTDEISKYKLWIEEKESEVSRIKNGAEISHKEKQLREIETDLIDLKNSHSIENNEKVNVKRREVYKLGDEIENIEYENNKMKRNVNDGSSTVERLTEATVKLRKEWQEVNVRVFNFDQDENCPSCGQALQESKLQMAREKALATFNDGKSKHLGKINDEGKKNAEAIKVTKQQNDTLTNRINEKENELGELQKQIKSLEAEVKDMESSVTSIEENSDYQAKKKQTEAIKLEINELKSSVDETISKVRNEIASFKAKVETLETDKSKFNAAKQAKLRIKELSDQERELAKEYEKLEKQLYLSEEFIRCKVQLLEEKINSKFKFARFKLFDQQINDGLRENCETLFRGIPYSSGLNNAARINIGLDIISTLSDHYEFSAPIFVDNAEAVTNLIEMDTQIISLVVSEDDKTLRVAR